MKQLNNKINFLSIALIALTLFLNSCGGSMPKEKTISASDISISGNASEFFKVVDGDYILKVVDDKVVIAVKFELVKECPNSDTKMGNLTLIPLDKTGVAIPDLGLDFTPATMSDWDKAEDLLKGEVGKNVMVSFEWSYFSDKDRQKRIMNETENFEITRADFPEYTPINNSSNISSSNSKDWDEILESYEEYIDKYIALLKKTQNGDMDAMTEYAEMMEKATDLAEKLEDADDELSTTQASKFLKLQTKLANAAMEMQ